MDDGTLSVDTVKEGKTLFSAVEGTLSAMGMTAHKLATDTDEILRGISTDRLVKDNTAVYVLGALWNTRKNLLSFPGVPQPDAHEKITKRLVLKTCNTLFDLTGITQPYLLLCKLLIQDLSGKAQPQLPL